MNRIAKQLPVLVGLAGLLLLATEVRSQDELVPPGLPREQRENLARFLKQHDKAERYVPQGARIVGPRGQAEAEPQAAPTPPGQSVKQYLVQVTPHRPVPGQEQVKHADVYYYRPNPEKGKQGITVKRTVDLTTGEQVGAPQVLLNQHTAISRGELDEAVALTKEKSQALQELYKGPSGKTVRWEYLQVMVGRKNNEHEPGDRVVRLVFTAGMDEAAPPPQRYIVNLTKGTVVADGR